MLHHIKPYFPSGASLFLGLGFQVSGYTSEILAWCFFVLAALFLLIPAWPYLRPRLPAWVPLAAGRGPLMPLPEAVMWFYEQSRSQPQFAQYIDKYEEKPAKLPKMAAEMLLGETGTSVTLYGTYPPRTVIEKIPDTHASQWRFSDDATELIDQFDDGRRYTQLQIHRTDIERRVKELWG